MKKIDAKDLTQTLDTTHTIATTPQDIRSIGRVMQLIGKDWMLVTACLLYTSPSPRDS